MTIGGSVLLEGVGVDDLLKAPLHPPDARLRLLDGVDGGGACCIVDEGGASLSHGREDAQLKASGGCRETRRQSLRRARRPAGLRGRKGGEIVDLLSSGSGGGGSRVGARPTANVGRLRRRWRQARL